MATYNAISFIAPNYRDYSSWWLKCYTPGTTSPIQLSNDSIGTTFFAKVQLDVNGFLTSDGTTLIIPHVATKYDAYLFPTEAEADANDTINALRVADDISPTGTGTESDLVLSTPFSFTASTDDQTVFDLGALFGTNPTVTNVFVEGRQQDGIGNGSSAVAYTLSGTVITLAEGVPSGTLVTGTANSLTSTVQALPAGSRGNPHQFDTKALLEASGDTLAIGSWAEIYGGGSKYDQANALYLIVNDGDVGASDGDRIIQLTTRKAFRFYSGVDNTGGDTVATDNFPYDFSYPASELERNEMLTLVADDSIGYGGSTWWMNAPMGRKENNVDVIYRSSTYGTPENRDLEQGSMDSVLWTNKRLGEAVKIVTRLVYDGAATDPVEYSQVGINDKLISHREDEHQQPAVLFNNKNGQLIVSSGNRNDARTQDGADVSNINYIRYGQDSNTLSVSETVEYSVTADYAQGFFVGSTAYWFSRVNVGEWSFTRGSGGQNYLDPIQFFDPSTDQYYFNIAIVDKTQDPSVDPQSAVDRTKVHFFGQSHPTIVADRVLRYAVGTFILAGQEAAPFNGGGLFVTQIDGTTQLGSNTSGRLDNTFVPFVKADMNTAYTVPVGSSYRLLDVQYGDTPSALIAEFVFDWTHGDSVPYQKTWDLKQVRWNGSSWDVLTIANGLRGMLGYEPQANASPSGLGIEGFTSAYVLGACYQRSEMHSDLLPVIYYCDRAGDAKADYRLHKVTLNASYTSVDSDVVIKTSDKILYRPESTLYGEKRVLWYNEGEWSSFNSFVAKDKFINEV